MEGKSAVENLEQKSLGEKVVKLVVFKEESWRGGAAFLFVLMGREGNKGIDRNFPLFQVKNASREDIHQCATEG